MSKPAKTFVAGTELASIAQEDAENTPSQAPSRKRRIVLSANAIAAVNKLN